MATINVKVCDKCDIQDGVQTWNLGRQAEVVEVDLCQEHGQTLEEVFASGTKVRRKSTQRRRGPSRTVVTTMEEIERLKKKS